MQSAFRVSKSAIFEQASPFSLGKREIDHIPQAVMDSIEGLADPAKVLVSELKKCPKDQYSIASTKDDNVENAENIHPNVGRPIKLLSRPFVADPFRQRVPMGVISLNDEAYI